MDLNKMKERRRGKFIEDVLEFEDIWLVIVFNCFNI